MDRRSLLQLAANGHTLEEINRIRKETTMSGFTVETETPVVEPTEEQIAEMMEALKDVPLNASDSEIWGDPEAEKLETEED